MIYLVVFYERFILIKLSRLGISLYHRNIKEKEHISSRWFVHLIIHLFLLHIQGAWIQLKIVYYYLKQIHCTGITEKIHTLTFQWETRKYMGFKPRVSREKRLVNSLPVLSNILGIETLGEHVIIKGRGGNWYEYQRCKNGGRLIPKTIIWI